MGVQKPLTTIAVITMAVLGFALAGCDIGRPLTPGGTPAPSLQAPPEVPGSGGQEVPPAPETERPDPRTFVHRFMRCRLLEPFGDRAYAMLTERGKQAFINGSDPTLGGAPVMQRMTGYSLEDMAGGNGSWTATVSIRLTGPADKAESMFYRERLTIVPRGGGFAVDNWEPGSPTQAYAARGWTTLCLKDAAGKERTVMTSGQIPVPFTPQGDNPQQTITSAGEFKCVALFSDGRAAFATLGLFGSTVGVAAEGQKAQVLARYEGGVNELVWAPGGRLLAVEGQLPSGKTDIVIYDVAADRPVLTVSEVVPEKQGNLTSGCWLADDRCFYFFTAATGEPPKLWELDLDTGRARPAEV